MLNIDLTLFAKSIINFRKIRGVNHKLDHNF